MSINPENQVEQPVVCKWPEQQKQKTTWPAIKAAIGLLLFSGGVIGQLQVIFILIGGLLLADGLRQLWRAQKCRAHEKQL